MRQWQRNQTRLSVPDRSGEADSSRTSRARLHFMRLQRKGDREIAILPIASVEFGRSAPAAGSATTPSSTSTVTEASTWVTDHWETRSLSAAFIADSILRFEAAWANPSADLRNNEQLEEFQAQWGRALRDQLRAPRDESEPLPHIVAAHPSFRRSYWSAGILSRSAEPPQFEIATDPRYVGIDLGAAVHNLPLSTIYVTPCPNRTYVEEICSRLNDSPRFVGASVITGDVFVDRALAEADEGIDIS